MKRLDPRSSLTWEPRAEQFLAFNVTNFRDLNSKIALVLQQVRDRHQNQKVHSHIKVVALEESIRTFFQRQGLQIDQKFEVTTPDKF